MTDYTTLLYDIPAPGVARITQNRLEARNAQNAELTYELNDAFDRAVRDDDVKVIILAGSGPHFSSGHDMRGGGKTLADFEPVGTWGGFDKPGHGRLHGARGGDLLRDVPPLARPQQADHRYGAG